MNAELLLKEISGISKKYDLIRQKTGGYFNIFEIADIATKEVIICRVLYELLSPTGSHFQGSTYLRLFFESVLHIDVSDDELQTVTIYREYIIDESRRIDIVIKSNLRFIPIEVKIFAGEQYKQCYDYYQKAVDSNVYYLTRFGDSPSKYSAEGLTINEYGYNEVTNISFATDILRWLSLCLAQKETIKLAPIREVLIQLSEVIHHFTNQMEDDKEMEIQHIIMASAENMKSAIEIEKSISACKITMIKRIFSAIEQRLLPHNKLHNKYDYKDLADGFYNHKYSTYPGISYMCKQDIKPNVDIWARIEIDDKIFAGFCVAVNGEDREQVLSKSEIESFINGKKACIDNWWAYWEYLPVDDVSKSPDFKNANDAFFALFDPVKFDTFIDTCVNKLNELLTINGNI